jgi:hypothetical protein
MNGGDQKDIEMREIVSMVGVILNCGLKGAMACEQSETVRILHD